MIKPIFPDYPLKAKDEVLDWLASSEIKDILSGDQAFQIISLLNRKRGRSEETFMGLRGEIERFLIWCLQASRPLSEINVDDIIEYVNFCGAVPAGLVSAHRVRRYLPNGNVNPDWRPFYVKGFQGKSKTVRRNRSQATVARQFSFLNMLFAELIEYELVPKNPVSKARRESPVVIRNTDEKPPKIFSRDYWQELFLVLEWLADNDPAYERPLFIFAIMKSCYLRVSELSERPYWQPKFSDFYYRQGYLFLRVMGKRRKVRSVSVPDSVIPYIERYRATRSLQEIPLEADDAPIVAKHHGFGGLTQRHLRRIIKDTLKRLSNEVSSPFLKETLISAASHWMRHTGATMDAKTRSLADLAKELGHQDPGTTGRLYVHSDMVERAKAGKSRSLL